MTSVATKMGSCGSVERVLTGLCLRRRGARRAAVWLGVAWLIAGLILAWVLIGSAWVVPAGVKIVGLMTAVLVLGFGVAGSFVGQAMTRSRVLGCAGEIERRHDLKNNLLINAVLLWPGEESAPQGLSGVLARRCADRAGRVLETIDLDAMIDRRPVRRQGVALLAVAIAWAGVAALRPGLIVDGWGRLIEPMAGYFTTHTARLEESVASRPPGVSGSESARGRVSTGTPAGEEEGSVREELITRLRRLLGVASGISEQVEILSGVWDGPGGADAGLSEMNSRLAEFSGSSREAAGWLRDRAGLHGTINQLEAMALLGVQPYDGQRGGEKSAWLNSVRQAAAADARTLAASVARLEPRGGGGGLVGAGGGGRGVGQGTGAGAPLASGDYEEWIEAQASRAGEGEAFMQQVPEMYRRAVAAYFARLARDRSKTKQTTGQEQ